MNKLRNNIILSCLILVLSLSSGFAWDWPWAAASSKYKGPTNVGEFSLMRITAENHPPIYTDAYAKTVKNVDYGLGLQNGFVVPPAYNLGSIESRLKFAGNELLGYFQPGTAIELFVDGEKQSEAYPLVDKFERTLFFGDTQVTLKMETKQLPILPKVGMKSDDPAGYQNGKVYFVTMQVAEIGPMQPGSVKTEESSEWFSPTLRYDYEKLVRGLKDKYLSGVDLDKLSEQELEDLARKMSAERRDLGIKYKTATPEFLRKDIYERNMKKYGDKYGPTISYLRNVQGKTWRQIIESSTEPGGKDVWGTQPSYKLGEWKHAIGEWWYGKSK